MLAASFLGDGRAATSAQRNCLWMAPSRKSRLFVAQRHSVGRPRPTPEAQINPQWETLDVRS